MLNVKMAHGHLNSGVIVADLIGVPVCVPGLDMPSYGHATASVP